MQVKGTHEKKSDKATKKRRCQLLIGTLTYRRRKGLQSKRIFLLNHPPGTDRYQRSASYHCVLAGRVESPLSANDRERWGIIKRTVSMQARRLVYCVPDFVPSNGIKRAESP